MDAAPSDDRLLGDYRLIERLDVDGSRSLWLAEQVSVRRAVIVELLEHPDEAQRSRFLEDVRAKAAVDHPLIGSVYEAVAEGPDCYCAYERLGGRALSTPPADGSLLPPLRIAHFLRRIAEANLHLEERGQASEPLTLDDVKVDDHGLVRITNLAIAGTRERGQSERDLAEIGRGLAPLVPARQPGATRLRTVLEWMRGENLDRQITWEETRGYCEQIELQLADHKDAAPDEGPALRSGLHSVRWIAIATGFALIVILLVALRLRPSQEPPVPRVPLPEPVAIAAGLHPTPDGATADLPAFRITAHEVTIGEYGAFLDTLRLLQKDEQQHAYSHPTQPAEKTSHVPSDWIALLAAARDEGVWQGRRVTLDSPVVGVDWWDAVAYANWRRGRLPSQDEWFAAASAEGQDPAEIPPGPWQPANEETPDLSASGMLSLAGSLAEWTGAPAPNPNNPLGEPLWVIIGGSYLKPESNALSREWTDDRAQRRPDLGFRIVLPPPAPDAEPDSR